MGRWFDPVEVPADGLVAPTPRAGFEAALLPALQRTPCVVAFSGGRDSSAILAPGISLEPHCGGTLRYSSTPVLRCAGRRSVTMAAANFRRIFAADDVTYHEPFLDPAFLVPFSRAGGWRGWITRTSMMRMLFGDVLPDEICRRNEKARFGGVAVGETSRAFLADWRSEGVDSDVVDIEAFRAAVNAEAPVYGVQLLLQGAWLAVNRDRGATTAADAS